MTGTGILTRRCNPFGNATDRGPKGLLGGYFGPEYEGGYKWNCEKPAVGTYQMICRCGHRGQRMELCGPSVTPGADGKPMFNEGHNSRSFIDRVGGACPKCLFPEEARMWSQAAERDQAELGRYQAAGMAFSPHATMLRRKVEEARARLDELNESGRIHKCPLTLTEIS